MPDTRFKPGESGNPRGRPRRKSVREMVGEQGMASIVDQLKAAAAQGKDLPMSAVQAAKLLIPPQKPELARVVIPALENASTHAEKAQAITAAAARGEISPEAAVALSTVVANTAKVAEIDDLARRLAAIEEQLKERTA
jgi:hypothetical protein